MSAPASARWLPLFGAIFFCSMIFAPLQYEPLDAPATGAMTTAETPQIGHGGLTVKLPRFQPFGMAVLVKHFFPDTVGTRMSSLVGKYRGKPEQIPMSVMHLFFLCFVVSHFLTILLGKSLFRLQDTHTTFFSSAYLKLLFGSVFAAILLGLDAWSLFDAMMRHEEFFTVLRANTNIQNPTYATLWFTTVVILITLLVAVKREQQCPTLVQKIYYFAESLIILEIIFNSFTNIDIILFLLSHPFPQFSSDFNPFFKPSWLTNPAILLPESAPTL